MKSVLFFLGRFVLTSMNVRQALPGTVSPTPSASTHGSVLPKVKASCGSLPQALGPLLAVEISCRESKGLPGLMWLLTPYCSSLQGSYKCGACKPGFVGDQVSGCKSQSVRRCPNGEISPCHEKAECIVERDGSLSCAVRFKPPCEQRLLIPPSLALCLLCWVCHCPLLESLPDTDLLSCNT